MSAVHKAGRDLVAQYAGHLANVLNGNDRLGPDEPIVEIRPFQLYERITRGLAGSRRYLDGLVGLWAYPAPPDPEAAADAYFDLVLDRPIAQQHGRTSSAWRLRAALVAAAAAPVPAPPLELPAMSTWKAMVDGPSRIRRFRERSSLYQLSNLILKCLDAANRPYAEVLRMGLCPRDWLSGEEEVGVSQLKAANRFLKALRAAMGGELGRRPTAAELETAFAVAPVPGSATAEAFARTPLGSAMLTRVAGQDNVWLVPFDQVEDELPEVDQPEADRLLDADEASPLLDRAVRSGAIGEDERALLAAILEGRPLAEAMRSDLGLRRRLKASHGGDLAAYVEDLCARVAAFVENASRTGP